MVRKSRKTAAKYSELSKARKGKPRNANGFQHRVTETTAAGNANDSGINIRPRSTTAVKPEAKQLSKTMQSLPGYEYVRSDLKRIGILSGVAVIILILLTFVLG